MKYNNHSAEYLKKMLLDIYQCNVAFQICVIDDIKPKTRMGVYIPHKRKIKVYSKWKEVSSIEEIAIHEYAHHIHETEKRRTNNRRKERTHGPEFWRIYSALISIAITKKVCDDFLISDIIIPKH